MSQQDYVHALEIKDRKNLDDRRKKYLDICQEKLGFVPNVIQAYAFDNDKLKTFADFYNDLMLSDSGLSKLEREMVAVVVSSVNKCFYCLTAHGAAVRELSGDPILGEVLIMNFRAGDLSPRHRAMCEFAEKLTETPSKIDDADRQCLRDVGFSDPDIWDISATASFYNMSNRMASAIDMMPNREYHRQAR
jgi:uncharacterized peroxidase-related enzyme